MIGQELNNRYKITARLGKGAMGTVYRATDTQVGQEVALKIISSDLTINDEMLERFKREGEALRKLKHPNIVGFLDAFQHGEQYVIVMEYVAGGSLQDLIKNGPMPIEKARRIALELCDALIRSHHLDIIHRDIKPENVLIDEDGTPKLADFGVARLSEGTRMTRSGTQVGTPYYMAPEAWEGKSLDAQADIWSLGVLLFEMLAGQVPFGGDTGPVVMTKVLTTQPPDLKKLRTDLPPDLVQLNRRMLTRDKKRRYSTMRQLAADLERIKVPEDGAVKKIRRWMPASVGIGLALTIAAIWWWNQSPRTQSIPQAEQPQNTPNETTVTAGETPNVDQTKTGKDSAILLYIPEGEFFMGSSVDANERPLHKIDLDAFWIDKTEVTNAMYAVCVEAGSCSLPRGTTHFRDQTQYGEHPVVYVDWDMANAYCSWAERRLPTEAEWEKAARGTDGGTYPWGEGINCDRSNYTSSCVGDTTKVGSFESGNSPYGVYDMAGNVWEWVASLYKAYPYDPNDGREDLTASGNRVLRGGSWADADYGARSMFRNGQSSSVNANDVGFRCATSLP